MFKKVIYNCTTKSEEIEEYTQEEVENIKKIQEGNKEINLSNRVKILEDENVKLKEDTKILASAMLNILEPMLLPEDSGDNNNCDLELLEKLNNIVQH